MRQQQKPSTWRTRMRFKVRTLKNSVSQLWSNIQGILCFYLKEMFDIITRKQQELIAVQETGRIGQFQQIIVYNIDTTRTSHERLHSDPSTKHSADQKSFLVISHRGLTPNFTML